MSKLCDTWLCDASGHARFVAGLRLSPADAELTRSVLAFNTSKAQAAATQEDLRKVVKAFLKPLREREAVRTTATELDVPAAQTGPGSFHAWLSQRPAADRHRPIHKCRRILAGVGSWPLGWLKTRGVVCYERAAGRIRQERGGRPDSAFLKGIVRTRELATLTANASDHYVVLTPHREPRFMTVEETMRAFGITEGGRMWKALRARSGVLSPAAAISCLGRSVHTGVARQVVKKLVADGAVSAGCRYGSAYSGVDTFAAAVEAELGNDWRYEFASEPSPAVRRGLLYAWGPKGLREQMCFHDAGGEDATSAPTVDLFVITPECTAHSRRNHDQSAQDQRCSLEAFWSSLEYVREQRPGVVVVENVHEPSSTGPMTGLLGRIGGYSMEVGTLDPRSVAKMPIARVRSYWVLKRE